MNVLERALEDLEDWTRSYGPNNKTLDVIAALKEAINRPQVDAPQQQGDPLAAAPKPEEKN